MLHLNTPEIKWHSLQKESDAKALAERVLCIDAHPKYRYIASGGADHDLNLWYWPEEQVGTDGLVATNTRIPEPLVSLEGHCGEINAVRWSHDGRFLASGGSDGVLVLWRCSFDGKSVAMHHQVRVGSAIYDISWNQKGTHIVIGVEMDSCLVVFVGKEGQKARVVQTMEHSHKHIVCGVVWGIDLGVSSKKGVESEALLSVSHDQTARLHQRLQNTGTDATVVKFKSLKPIHRYLEDAKPVVDDVPMYNNENKKVSNVITDKQLSGKQFCRENVCHSFFRRPSATTDGLFCAIPSARLGGCALPVCDKIQTEEIYATNVYCYRLNLVQPLWQLSSPTNAASTVCRFYPDVVIFPETFNGIKHNILAIGSSDGTVEIWRLPCGACDMSVLGNYKPPPERIAVFAALHHQTITDLAWMSDHQAVDATERAPECKTRHEIIKVPLNQSDQVESVRIKGKRRAVMLPLEENELVTMNSVFCDHLISRDDSVIMDGNEIQKQHYPTLMISSSDGYVSFLVFEDCFMRCKQV